MTTIGAGPRAIEQRLAAAVGKREMRDRRWPFAVVWPLTQDDVSRILLRTRRALAGES